MGRGGVHNPDGANRPHRDVLLYQIISIESCKDYAILQPMDKRQFPRFPFNESIGLCKQGGLALSGSLANDLSIGGIRIRVGEFVALRSILQLKIFLSDPIRELDVRGQVVWVREVPHSDMFDVGISFIQAEYRDPSIGQFIYSKEIKNKAKEV